jgi:hypothetical protein
MYDRRTALTYARRFRTCPPWRIRSIPDERPRILVHDARCPICADPDLVDAPEWTSISHRLVTGLKESAGVPKELQSGALCWVKQDLGRWVDESYFNPPLVVVLNDESHVLDEAEVAQVYHDLVLAGPGDLILTDDQTGIGELFIEPWNRYTLRKQDLSAPVAILETDLICTVRLLSEDERRYPSWAMRPRPFKPEDPRIYFREMEIEVGYVFAGRSVSLLLDEVDTAALFSEYATPLQMIRELKEKYPVIRFPQKADDFLSALSKASYDEASLPMAADTGNRESGTAMAVFMDKGRVSSIKPISATLYKTHPEAEKYTCTGQIGPIHPGFTLHRAVFHLVKPDGTLIHASDEALDFESGVFSVQFPLSPVESSLLNLKVTLICQRQGEVEDG